MPSELKKRKAKYRSAKNDVVDAARAFCAVVETIGYDSPQAATQAGKLASALISFDLKSKALDDVRGKDGKEKHK